jgi:hypothetical protein
VKVLHLFRDGINPEMLENFHSLTRLSAREDCIEFCRHDSCKTRIIFLCIISGLVYRANIIFRCREDSGLMYFLLLTIKTYLHQMQRNF